MFVNMPPAYAHALDTASLLEQQKAHEKAKDEHIAAFLTEQADISAAHEKRQKEILADLKALGYTKPRAPRTKKDKV